MRILIAADDAEVSQSIRNALGQNWLDCPDGHAVALEAAADRVSRVVPALIVMALPSDIERGVAVLREICRTAPSAHLLVLGPATDPKLILRILHEGAAEYCDQAHLESELAEALIRFMARGAAPQGQDAGWVIAVLAASGGSGSSTVAANLSATLAQQYGQCGLIDLRLSAGDLASLLDLRPTHSIADLCDNLLRLDQSMFGQFFVRHSIGLSLLAAPSRFADIARVTPKGVRQALALARVRFPYVVADLENAFDAEQIEALWQSDVIVLVLRLDYTSVRNTRRAIENLVQLGINADRLRLVVNGHWERKQLSVSQAEEALGMKISHFIPNDPATVNLAVNKGVPAVLCRPSGKASRSLRQLAAQLNGHHKKTGKSDAVRSS